MRGRGQLSVNILLTGATGFIGSHLLDRLLSEKYKVYCLVRKTSNFRWIRDKKEEVIFREGDFLYPETLNNVMNDIDIVIHLAGSPYALDWHKYYLINFVGTKNLIQSAINSKNVKKFFYFSSQSAVGPLPKGEIRTEDMQPNPVSHSGKSKLLAEEEVLKYKEKLNVIILRPTIIYGPRDMHLVSLFKLAVRGFFISFGNMNRVVNICYIADLIEMFINLLSKDIKSGEIFFLGGNNYPIYEIRDLLQKIIGKKLRNIIIPDRLLPITAFFSETFGRIFKRDFIFNLDLVKELTKDNWAVSTEKISGFLGYLPYTPLKEGLKKTFEWYKSFYYL